MKYKEKEGLWYRKFFYFLIQFRLFETHHCYANNIDFHTDFQTLIISTVLFFQGGYCPFEIRCFRLFLKLSIDQESSKIEFYDNQIIYLKFEF